FVRGPPGPLLKSNPIFALQIVTLGTPWNLQGDHAMSDPMPSPIVSDRNLLFAVLALQTDLIDNDQFVEACTAWTARKHRPLAELLIERGWLTTQDRSDIERLLERKLHKHGGDLRASLAALIDHRSYQSLSRLDDRDIQESLAGLPSPSALPLTCEEI